MSVDRDKFLQKADPQEGFDLKPEFQDRLIDENSNMFEGAQGLPYIRRQALDDALGSINLGWVPGKRENEADRLVTLYRGARLEPNFLLRKIAYNEIRDLRRTNDPMREQLMDFIKNGFRPGKQVHMATLGAMFIFRVVREQFGNEFMDDLRYINPADVRKSLLEDELKGADRLLLGERAGIEPIIPKHQVDLRADIYHLAPFTGFPTVFVDSSAAVVRILDRNYNKVRPQAA